jgi:hypothetical protein
VPHHANVCSALWDSVTKPGQRWSNRFGPLRCARQPADRSRYGA